MTILLIKDWPSILYLTVQTVPLPKFHSGDHMGQLFQYFEAPSRFGLPPFYTLHVWAWKENPNGAFVNWHPHISCKAFNDKSNFQNEPGRRRDRHRPDCCHCDL